MGGPPPLTPPPGAGNFLKCRLSSAAALDNRHFCFSPLPVEIVGESESTHYPINHLINKGAGNFLKCRLSSAPTRSITGTSVFLLCQWES